MCRHLRNRAANLCNWVDFPLPSPPSKVMKWPRLVVDKMQNLLQIFPGFLLRILIVRPQQIQYVIHRDSRAICASCRATGRRPVPEQSLRRRRAQRANRFRLNRQVGENRDSHKISIASGRGVPAPGGPAFHDVGGDKTASAESGCLLLTPCYQCHLRQQLAPRDPRTADAARRHLQRDLRHAKNQGGVLIAGAEYDLVSRWQSRLQRQQLSPMSARILASESSGGARGMISMALRDAWRR